MGTGQGSAGGSRDRCVHAGEKPHLLFLPAADVEMHKRELHRMKCVHAGSPD